MQRVLPLALLVTSVFTLLPETAHAGSITLSGSGAGANGVTLNASALFEISGSTLTITLRNTGDTSGSLADVSANALTGLFFDLPTGVRLTPILASADSFINGGLCEPDCLNVPTNVGGEFVYARSKTGQTTTTILGDHGISSSGYIGGSKFPGGTDLHPPSSPNGANFAIIADTTATNPFNPNGGLGNDPLIEDHVVFTMTIVKDGDPYGGLLTSQISNVSFQYGTGFNEPRLPGLLLTPNPTGVPEPATLLLLAPALAFALRRRKASKDSQ